MIEQDHRRPLIASEVQCVLERYSRATSATSVTSVSCDTPLKITWRAPAGPVPSGCGDDRRDFCCHRDCVAGVSRPAFRTPSRATRSCWRTPIRRIASPTQCASSVMAPLRFLIRTSKRSQSFEVSTPQTRQAAVNDLRRLERLAASRRRRVLLGLMAALSGVVGLCAVASHPVVECSHPGRAAVDLPRRGPDQRSDHAREGSMLVIAKFAMAVTSRPSSSAGRTSPRAAQDAHAASGTADVAASPGTLWDPIPITMPTYVSKPLAPGRFARSTCQARKCRPRHEHEDRSPRTRRTRASDSPPPKRAANRAR